MSNLPAAAGASGKSPKAPFLTTLAPMALPGFFVLLWSTGFIVAKFGLPYAPPLTFLLLRFLGVLVILLPLVLLLRAPWRSEPCDISRWPASWCKPVTWPASGARSSSACRAGLSALIVGMQPVLTAFAAPLIGERVRPRQWIV